MKRWWDQPGREEQNPPPSTPFIYPPPGYHYEPMYPPYYQAFGSQYGWPPVYTHGFPYAHPLGFPYQASHALSLAPPQRPAQASALEGSKDVMVDDSLDKCELICSRNGDDINDRLDNEGSKDLMVDASIDQYNLICGRTGDDIKDRFDNDASPMASFKNNMKNTPPLHDFEDENVPMEISISGNGDIGENLEQSSVRDIQRPDTHTTHLCLRDIVNYFKNHQYPSYLSKNQKPNFRRQIKAYNYIGGRLKYHREGHADWLEVIMERKEQLRIIASAHEGSTSSVQAAALSGHRGRDAVISILRKRYHWPGMSQDVREYIRTCLPCQRANKATLKIVPPLRPVPVPKQVMKKVGVDICQLPPSGGLQYVVICIDYFTKWSMAKALPDKSAASVAEFLYECICDHSCYKIQINDQGREFVNQVSNKLHELCGVKQCITSAYHPQANGLVERQVRTVKSFLIKVLQENVQDWPKCLKGVLFAHRTMAHSSTGFSPFFLMYGREPILPIDVERGVLDIEDEDVPTALIGDGKECEEATIDGGADPFEAQEFIKRVKSFVEIRKKVLEDVPEKVSDNIKAAQQKQKELYDKRHHTAMETFKVGDMVMVYNPRNEFRKGGKTELPYSVPYQVTHIDEKKRCQLKNLKTNLILKTRQAMHRLKVYNQRPLDMEVQGESEIKMTKKKIVKDMKINLEVKETVEEYPINIMEEELCEDGQKTGSEENLNVKSQERDEKNMESDAHVECDLVITEENTYTNYFCPVGKQWQEEKCLSFNLKVVKGLRTGIPSKILASKPSQVHHIRGDGNCFFRAVSYVLTGSEESHDRVRILITNFMLQEEFQKKIVAYNNNPKYFSTWKMTENGTWATDTEIMCTAAWLQTDVYIYTKVPSADNPRLKRQDPQKWTWQIFDKDMHQRFVRETSDKKTLRSVTRTHEPSVYLENISGNHFNVVVNVY